MERTAVIWLSDLSSFSTYSEGLDAIEVGDVQRRLIDQHRRQGDVLQDRLVLEEVELLKTMPTKVTMGALRHQRTFGRNNSNGRLELTSCRWDGMVGPAATMS